MDALEKVLDEMFAENQAKLPHSERCAATKSEMCKQTSHNSYTCTLPKGHAGEHIAHGSLGFVVWRWPNINAIVAEHVLAKGHEQEQSGTVD